MKVAVKDITNTISADELDAGRLQDTFEISVKNGSKVTLPESFTTPMRADLVKLAVASSRATEDNHTVLDLTKAKSVQWRV